MGFTVTFSAFGGTTDAETPTVNPALMEPAETWTFPISFANAPQVSENTYLNETCTVTEIDTQQVLQSRFYVESLSGPVE
jgi:hypothetical protein